MQRFIKTGAEEGTSALTECRTPRCGVVSTLLCYKKKKKNLFAASTHTQRNEGCTDFNQGSLCLIEVIDAAHELVISKVSLKQKGNSTITITAGGG